MKLAVICFCCVFFGGLALVCWTGSQIDIPQEPTQSPEADGIAPVDFTNEVQRRWKIHMDSPDSKGWKQTGEMQVELAEALQDVEVLMASSGYVGRHSVGGVDDGYALIQYEAQDNMKVIWSLRRTGARLTSFSWGWSK